MKVIEKIVDIQTGEEIVNERDETKEEKAQRLADEKKAIEQKAQAQALQVEADAKAIAKAAAEAKLAALGLTTDDLRALGL